MRASSLFYWVVTVQYLFSVTGPDACADSEPSGECFSAARTH